VNKDQVKGSTLQVTTKALLTITLIEVMEQAKVNHFKDLIAKQTKSYTMEKA
jgi:hypothetical protein